MEHDIVDLIQKLPEYFVPERAKGTHVTAQLNLQKETTEYWTLQIADQQCFVSKGKTEKPQLELTAKVEDLLAVLSGQLSASRAYMQGKLHLRGSMMQALKISELFNIPADLMKNLKM